MKTIVDAMELVFLGLYTLAMVSTVIIVLLFISIFLILI